MNAHMRRCGALTVLAALTVASLSACGHDDPESDPEPVPTVTITATPTPTVTVTPTPHPQGDASDLEDAIEEAEADLRGATVTNRARPEVEAEIERAKDMLTDASATQSDLDDEAWTVGHLGTQLALGEDGSLVTVVQECEDDLTRASATNSGRDAMESELARAHALLADPTATQGQWDAEADALISLRGGLTTGEMDG